MSAKNDERIMKLREEIERKEKDLKGKSSRFQPITNCIFNFSGGVYNIHTMSEGGLTYTLIRLNALRISMKDLGIDESTVLDGFDFPLVDIISDIKSRISMLQYNREKSKLARLKDELTKLLSDDKQTELEIDKIEKLIGG